MKHNLKVTLILTILFLLAHIIGLIITNIYNVQTLPFDIERPVIEGSTSYVPIIIAIVIATVLALLLMKYGAMKLWKLWFIFATIYLLGIAFSAFMLQTWALGLAIVLGLLKGFKLNVIIHNFTELFVYSGIAAIFAPIMSILAAFILLIIISIYDAIAVWKTKHMVKMAKFQSKSKLFAGLLVPYGKDKIGILGGGDIGFTLLFSGVVLIKYGFLSAIITSLVTTLSLFGLFIFSSKNKFYPAMPFLSGGCLLGFLISLLF